MCYCGRHSKPVSCSDKGFAKRSVVQKDDGVKSWLGFYECTDPCGRYQSPFAQSNARIFDCGIHACVKRCHPQDPAILGCPRSPEDVKFCPCGKTAINDLIVRKSCEDPIPVCDKTCGKVLPCGHACQSSCHLGDCRPCENVILATCRCRKSKINVKCSDHGQEELLCERNCTSMKSCGRHHCGIRCCTGDHLCTKICGRPLKCGSHNCTVLCHRGPCPSCLEASFEPLVCLCGRTEVSPPIRCGTKPPQCPHPCIIDPPCGHSKVVHTCHPADEECPKCPYLVENICMCGKRSVKHQPCFRAQTGMISCGMACGALMPCGFHRCAASWYFP